MMSELEQIRNLESDNRQCQNCIDTVFMDDLGDGFYRCPVCGDEYDSRYPKSAPFEDKEEEFEQRDDTCSMCNGTGLDYDGGSKCPKCDGEGFYYWL